MGIGFILNHGAGVSLTPGFKHDVKPVMGLIPYIDFLSGDRIAIGDDWARKRPERVGKVCFGFGISSV